MTATAIDAAIEDYLRQLDRALAALPGPRRAQLVAEIADHIGTAREQLDDPGEADIRNLLDRIGRPEDIAAEAIDTEPPPTMPRRSGLHETFAIALLLVGGFLCVAGWFVGLVLLWTSNVWRLRDKVIGTLLVPGGLLPAFILIAFPLSTVGARTCVSATIPAGGTPVSTPVTCSTHIGGNTLWLVFSIGLFAAAIIIPILTAVYLNRRRSIA